MKILYYIPNKGHEVDQTFIAKLADAGVGVAMLHPTLLSAFSAMNIAKTVDSREIDIVECISSADAVAAVSARKLAKRNFRIIVNIQPNTTVPRSVPSDVRAGVDAWIFPSERLMESYPAELKNKTLIPTTAMIEEERLPYPTANTPVVITWIGKIVDSDRLQRVISALDDSDGSFVLRICGTGNAADVMPAVKYSRGINNKENITWLADDYYINDEISRAHAVVRTADDLTPIDASAMFHGRPALLPEQITEFVKTLSVTGKAHMETGMTPPDEYIRSYVKLYSNLVNNI